MLAVVHVGVQRNQRQLRTRSSRSPPSPSGSRSLLRVGMDVPCGGARRPEVPLDPSAVLWESFSVADGRRRERRARIGSLQWSPLSPRSERRRNRRRVTATPTSGREARSRRAVRWRSRRRGGRRDVHTAPDWDSGLPKSSSAAQTPMSSTTLSALAVPPATTPVTAQPDLDDLLVDFVGDRDGGGAVLVVRNGTTTTAAAGDANAAGDLIRPATPFRVGSISKPFVATMVLQLVDEGRVDLDEPLSAHLPDTPIGGDVTTRALLSHRSGLPNCTDVGGLIRDVLADRSRVLTPIDILSYIEAVKPGESDQHFASSNTNDILSGQLVEHLDGADPVDWGQVSVWEPPSPLRHVVAQYA